jgi:hypothetical protein
MRSKSKPFKIACLAVLPLFLSACFKVQVIGHARDPQAYFDKAYRQLDRLERDYPDRKGRAHKLVVLIHEDSEDQIVKVSVPIWLANFGMKVGMKAAEHEHKSNKWKDRYELEWRAIKDLGRFGPGLLVSIDEDRDKVLIWLE